MTDGSGSDGGDGPPKPPERPDPFAPLPLANLPPVRRRSPLDAAVEPPRSRKPAVERAGAEPGGSKPVKSGAPDTHAPAAIAPATSEPPDTRQPPPPASAAPAPPLEPTPPEPVSWTDASGTTKSTAASWTDLPGPASGPIPTGPSSEPASGALSWTDLPAPIAAPMVESTAANEPPLLPVESTEDELRAAIGAAPRPEAPVRSRRRAPTAVEGDDDDGGDGPSTPRNRKLMLVGALTLVVGGGIAAMVIVGKVNSERLLITCKDDRVAVEQGRSFPPWGESTLEGAEWKALKIPPEAPCAPFETEDKAELAAHYFDILKDHATTLLTAREVTKIDDAEAQLKQALLVTRSLAREDDRIDARAEIERLLGDVVYWRASAKLRSASDALVEAANQFEVASAQRPRHVTDAAAWSLYIRKLVEQLRAGPAGAAQTTFPPLPPSERPSAPPGVALPVEPGAGSGSAAESAPPPPADAGAPTGGVLL